MRFCTPRKSVDSSRKLFCIVSAAFSLVVSLRRESGMISSTGSGLAGSWVACGGVTRGLLACGGVARGSLARGGLSGIWGAGAAQYAAGDLDAFPFDGAELLESYTRVGQRVGLSGVNDDDLAGFLGTDVALQPPAALGANATRLLSRYTRRRAAFHAQGIALGHARNAVLTQDLGQRRACTLCGQCLWGCDRESIYSARHDLPALEAHPDFTYRGGVRVTQVVGGDAPRLLCGSETLEAPRILLACGTLGSTALVLGALGRPERPLRLASTPAAGFALLLPERLGRPPADELFGLSQLTLLHEDPTSGDTAYGNLFEADPVPLIDFARHSPISRPTARRMIGVMRSAMLVGNVFFSGEYSDHTMTLDAQGRPHIHGGHSPALAGRIDRLRSAVSTALRRCGILVLPGSFQPGDPGADVHYAGTLPMSDAPRAWETDRDGEVTGLPGVHVVDGACLPSLPAKAHTLTIMANADRIGRRLAGHGAQRST